MGEDGGMKKISVYKINLFQLINLLFHNNIKKIRFKSICDMLVKN